MSSNETESADSNISLKGRFIIQKIYEMELKKKISYEDFLDITKKLPKFKAGTPEDPGNGFKLIEVEEPLGKIESDPILLELFNKLIMIEYKKEKFESIIVKYDDKGNPIEKKFPKIIQNHIFIVFPDYIIFRGSKIYLDFMESHFFNIVKDILSKR